MIQRLNDNNLYYIPTACSFLLPYLVIDQFPMAVRKIYKINKSNSIICLLMCHQVPKENSKLYTFN